MVSHPSRMILTGYLGTLFGIMLLSGQEKLLLLTLFKYLLFHRAVRCIIITHKFGWERYASQGSRRDSPLQRSRVQFGRKYVARKQ